MKQLIYLADWTLQTTSPSEIIFVRLYKKSTSQSIPISVFFDGRFKLINCINSGNYHDIFLNRDAYIFMYMKASKQFKAIFHSNLLQAYKYNKCFFENYSNTRILYENKGMKYNA